MRLCLAKAGIAENPRPPYGAIAPLSRRTGSFIGGAVTSTRPLPREFGPGQPGLIIGAVIVLVAARLAGAALIPLGPDETYYLLWSHFPAASYYDHPPMVAWWIAASTVLFGDSPFGVRAISTLSTIPSTVAVYLTGRVLFDRTTGERAALWINAMLLIGVGSILATPDAPAVMFWALAVLALALVMRTGQGVWWPAVGLCAGLGVLSKLTDLFLGLGVVLAAIAVRDLRRWLISPWFWTGGLVALVVVAPMLMWNAGHDWITLTKQFSRIDTGALTFVKPVEFIATQFAVLNPLVAIFVGLGIVVWIRRRPVNANGAMGLLAWTLIPIVAYMVVHSFHEAVQGHWLAPIFPTLAVIAAAAAGTARPERWAGLKALVFPVGAILSAAGLILAANPGGFLPFRLDPGQIIRDWDKVAADAEAMRRDAGAEWIATTYYGVEGEIAYHLRREGVPVIAVVERARYAYAPPPDPSLLGKPVLLVSKDAAGSLARCFVNVVSVGSIERRNGARLLDTFNVYKASGATAAAFDPGCDRAR